MKDGFRGAVAFLTPVGGAHDPGGLAWFPVVGAMIGGAVGLVWGLGGRAFNPVMAATLAVATDLAATGMLHLDGLADAADGLLPPLERSARLEVMAAPDVGAFGVGAVVIVLAARVAALASLRPNLLLVAGLWAMSRTVMAATVSRVPYAREGGLATPFLSGVGTLVVAAGLVLAGWLAGEWRPLIGPLAVLAGLGAAVGVVVLARRRIGGFTGDVLGAAGMVGETVGLVVACARW